MAEMLPRCARLFAIVVAANAIPGGLAESAPVVQRVVHGASYLNLPVSPGQLVEIQGTDLSLEFKVDYSNPRPTIILSTRVLFDGAPGRLEYVDSEYVGVYVPYNLEGRSSVTIVVEVAGVRSNAVTVAVSLAQIGIFTDSADGDGQAWVDNQDGSYNDDKTPAGSGEVVVIYGAGIGQTEPPGADGQEAPDSPLRRGRRNSNPLNFTCTLSSTSAGISRSCGNRLIVL